MGTLGAVRFFLAPWPASHGLPSTTASKPLPVNSRIAFPPCPEPGREDPSAPPPQRRPASLLCSRMPSVHFLSVYFFSVYTRSTPVAHGGHSCLPIFGGGNAIPSSRSKDLPKHAARGCLTPFWFSFLWAPLPKRTFQPVLFVPVRLFHWGALKGKKINHHHPPPKRRPRFRRKGVPMRTAILPGMHLNPSDFRS